MVGLSSAPTSFFLGTSDPEKSLKFYRDRLGLTFVEDSEYALVFRLSGAELRISKVPDFKPQGFTVLDWQVDDMDKALLHLASQSIELTRYDFMDQDDRGVWSTDDGTQIAWFKDPDGNVLSISKRA